MAEAGGPHLPFALSPKTRRAWRIALAFLLGLFALDLLFPPPLEKARAVSTVVTARDGAWLRAFPTRDEKWRLAAELEEIDREFLRGLIALEDGRFWLHPGVDPLAAARAAASYARTGEITSGASTITMQLARLLEPRPRTLPSKLVEMVRAVQIERRLSKRAILEAYLTLAPYGGNLEGVRAASRAYFGRDPVGLSDGEIALLLALPQAPEARRPDRRPEAARAARARLLSKFATQGLMSLRHAREAAAEPVPGRMPFPVRAHRFAERLALRHPSAARVTSTLDPGMQQAVETLLATRLSTLPADVSAAAIVVHTRSREVRVSVSGDGSERDGAWLDMTRAVRSPGSTLKPFIYALAFDDGAASPETLIEDAPMRFSGYMPENFDRRFHGEVRVSEALKHSLNLPAVALLERVGASRFEAALAEAGARPRFPRRALAEPGLALALGGVGMTLEELATLYAALGGDGVARPLRDEPGLVWDTSGERFVRPETARTVLAILAETPAPRGRAPAALTLEATPVAFKTGTSYGFRDAWAMGVTADYVVGVWIGRPDGAPRPGASGRDEALPILFDIVDRLGPQSNAPFRREREAPAAGLDRFARANADDPEAQAPVILFPPDGADILVDSVGPGSRGLSLSARGGAAPVTWYAEGAPVPAEETSGRAIWRPSAPGFYELIAIDGEGRRASVRVRIRMSG